MSRIIQWDMNSSFNNIYSQITASVTEANGMMHSADGETRELAVASLERAVASLQRVEKGAARLDNLICWIYRQ